LSCGRGCECRGYLLDTNILVSLLLGGIRIRRCLKTCRTRYLVPRLVVDEPLEIARSKDFGDIGDYSV